MLDLTRLRSRVRVWRRALWLMLKYGLAGLGAFAWIGLWFERSFWLGLAQLLIIVPACWAELEKRKATGRW